MAWWINGEDCVSLLPQANEGVTNCASEPSTRMA